MAKKKTLFDEIEAKAGGKSFDDWFDGAGMQESDREPLRKSWLAERETDSAPAQAEPEAAPEALPGELSQSDKEFLRRDAKQRARKDSGEDEVERMKNSAEVIDLLAEADGIEETRQGLCVSARRLEAELESFSPMDRATGPSFVSQIEEGRRQLRLGLVMGNHKHIHERVETLSLARVRNRTEPFLRYLKRDVDEFSYAVSHIPQYEKNLREQLAVYLERKKALPVGSTVTGLSVAVEGKREKGIFNWTV